MQIISWSADIYWVSLLVELHSLRIIGKLRAVKARQEEKNHGDCVNSQAEINTFKI